MAAPRCATKRLFWSSCSLHSWPLSLGLSCCYRYRYRGSLLLRLSPRPGRPCSGASHCARLPPQLCAQQQSIKVSVRSGSRPVLHCRFCILTGGTATGECGPSTYMNPHRTSVSIAAPRSATHTRCAYLKRVQKLQKVPLLPFLLSSGWRSMYVSTASKHCWTFNESHA